tara:strand:+ start:184 stop:1206 length:1023 start_codon:yes stop_codon:yes gene_type:complete
MKNDFNIRFAKISERNSIMSFIENYWSKDHILAHDHTLFDFQHLDNDRLNYVIALDTEGMIVGILGYISYGYKKENHDIALALWKVIPNLSDPLLGVKLIQFLQDNLNARYIHCVGVTKSVLGIYKYLGFNEGMLNHYAAFNKNCKNFKIAIPPSRIKALPKKCTYDFNQIASLDTSLKKLYKSEFYMEKIPYKTKEFFIKRYSRHPYFSYIFHEVTLKDVFKGFVVSREVKHDGGIALRIIEAVSQNENIANIINDFATILENSDYEYLDVYASGLDENTLTSKSFEKISDSANIIVPEYFQPFEMKNIDIYYVTTSKKTTILFKGDGDQDRPSLKMAV